MNRVAWPGSLRVSLWRWRSVRRWHCVVCPANLFHAGSILTKPIIRSGQTSHICHINYKHHVDAWNHVLRLTGLHAVMFSSFWRCEDMKMGVAARTSSRWHAILSKTSTTGGLSKIPESMHVLQLPKHSACPVMRELRYSKCVFCVILWSTFQAEPRSEQSTHTRQTRRYYTATAWHDLTIPQHVTKLQVHGLIQFQPVSVHKSNIKIAFL